MMLTGIRRAIARANDRIETSWVGDLIGTVSIFGALYVGLWLGELMR